MQRFIAALKLGYTEFQYWLVGMTPESYHFEQSRNYDQLGAAARAAHHAHELLKYAEYAEPRARLGYYYSMNGKTAEAAEHYRKAIEKWPHPSFVLALAQAELRLGRREVAIELLGRVESSEMRDQLLPAIEEVRAELAGTTAALE